MHSFGNSVVETFCCGLHMSDVISCVGSAFSRSQLSKRFRFGSFNFHLVISVVYCEYLGKIYFMHFSASVFRIFLVSLGRGAIHDVDSMEWSGLEALSKELALCAFHFEGFRSRFLLWNSIAGIANVQYYVLF